ncbi:1-acyl-sn-glycerol-3-phosphate acyltransferase [Clostridium acetireducens DSM 10703]|uniref:1-acyl-sn-glycerol-3-phosphate acyltransferase n=1 Tax=Clostridium acetireducens DSM 10703 TaxID=1121290 RepID=A0A1E8EWE4_9CLOT|nr:lysophospholipid acyltransferase family protein [Clostridium acetireducens]OFI01572.1 1-acyl-sn-glycerol-3-phosphate acyltransferase [Clostridium acetireducens DSM 10703]
MKTYLLYLYFIIYMILTAFKALKLKYIKKHGSKEEAEKYTHEYVKAWSRFIIKTVGIKVNTKGLENIPKRNCLFVANHQGIFDIPVMLYVIDTPMGFIAKKELLKIKIISSWMKEIHCVFMDRSNIRESIKSINEGIKNLKEGYSMAIFPEGTRSKGPKLGEFKKGSMKLAIKSGVPIVPVSIDGTYKIREGNNNKIKSAEVNIIINEPVYVENLTKEEKGNLAEIVKQKIAKSLPNP